MTKRTLQFIFVESHFSALPYIKGFIGKKGKIPPVLSSDSLACYDNRQRTISECKMQRNMLYFFQNEQEKTLMTLRSEKPLDSTDWQILRELQRDGRLSYNELGRRVGLSGPGAAERVHKLEDAGVLTSYGAQIDPTKVGLPLLAFIQLRCAPGQCFFKAGSAREFPEVLEMYKLSGSHCALLKVAVSSMRHLEAVNERLGRYGNQITNIVTSSVLTRRIIDWEHPDVDLSPPLHQGWIE